MECSGQWLEQVSATFRSLPCLRRKASCMETYSWSEHSFNTVPVSDSTDVWLNRFQDTWNAANNDCSIHPPHSSDNTSQNPTLTPLLSMLSIYIVHTLMCLKALCVKANGILILGICWPMIQECSHHNMSSTSQNSTLGSLPREMINMIYRKHLVSSHNTRYYCRQRLLLGRCVWWNHVSQHPMIFICHYIAKVQNGLVQLAWLILTVLTLVIWRSA